MATGAKRINWGKNLSAVYRQEVGTAAGCSLPEGRPSPPGVLFGKNA